MYKLIQYINNNNNAFQKSSLSWTSALNLASVAHRKKAARLTHRNLTGVSVTVWESERIEEILRHCSNTATALQNNRAPSCSHVPSTSHSNTTAPLQRGLLQWNRAEHKISSASVTQQIYTVIQVWQHCTDSREAHVNFQRDVMKPDNLHFPTGLYIILWSIFSSFKACKLILL